MHPNDLAAIVRALESGPVRLPPPPSDVPSGIDARVISEAVRAIVAEKIASFLTRGQIIELMDERLQFIGLRMDEAHIDETIDAIRGAVKWHKWMSRTFMATAATIVSGGVILVLHKAGVPVPVSP